MNENTQDLAISEPEHLISRGEALRAFSEVLPLNEFNLYTNRVFNLWGSKAVGKTTFLETLRDSNLMERKKVVWLSPKTDSSIDTPQEFIAACSEEVRFPQAPHREETIAKKLEESQKGKVDPIRSDDSLLITRSSIATNKKPYVNAAAASSVGRTSFIREDMEVSVGLGNNRAGNQAEAFLDALPLQSMGADLVLLHISHKDVLSGSVRDWFRDYVIPAASTGPYRRNLILVEESDEPVELQPTDHSWGDWDPYVADFELRPASIEAIIEFAHRQGCNRSYAHFTFVKSLGYPALAQEAVQQFSNQAEDTQASAALSKLPEEDRARIAICCLPESLIEDELDAVVGRGNAGEILKWLSRQPGVPLRETNEGDSYQLPDSFRAAAISSITESAAFRSAEERWLPYARLVHNVPSHSDRSRLYSLSGLRWIENDFCAGLFKENAESVSKFIDTRDSYFAKRQKYTHLSDRIRSDLFTTATHLNHPGVTSIVDTAKAIWEQRQTWLNERLEDLDRSLKVVEERLHVSRAKHSQVAILLKRFQKNGTPVPKAPDAKLENGKNGLYIGLLAAFAVGVVSISASQAAPLNAIGYFAGFIAVIASITLVPGWRLQQAAKESKRRAKIKNSPEYLKKENADLIQQIQENESAFDELSRDIALTKEDLKYAYI